MQLIFVISIFQRLFGGILGMSYILGLIGIDSECCFCVSQLHMKILLGNAMLENVESEADLSNKLCTYFL